MKERVIRALLVQNSDQEAQAILAALAAGGFSVISRRVETADQMRGALLGEDWNVVLSDLNLPAFGAIEALAILSTLGAKLPMIVATDAADAESASKVIEAGATEVVTKLALHRLVPVVERNVRELYEATVAAFKESETRFQAIAANLPGVVFQDLLYEDGSADLAYVSEGSHLVLGVTAERLMSHPELIIDMIVPEDRNSFVQARTQSAKQLTPRNWEGRIRVGTDGRETKWVNLRANVRRMSSGVVVSDGIISNITESKLTQRAIEAQQLQLRQLASHIEHVKEKERGHIAREIQDDLGGTMTAAKIDLAWLRARLKPELVKLVEKVDAMQALLDSAIEATGRISRSLRPLVLDYGVAAAIEWQVKEFRKRMGIPCDFVCSREDIAVDPEFATALFRIFQETLTNIAKHARATHVDISLEDDGTTVVLTVTDDGGGIDPDFDVHKAGSYGIRSMRERADFLGGNIDISGAPGAGTLVRVSLPAKRPSRAAESQ